MRAGNAHGWSGWVNSPPAGPYTPPDTSPPDAVDGVTLSRSGDTLTAAWNAPDGATKYHVTYSANNGQSWSLAAFGSAATSVDIDIDIDAAESYVVGVRAGNDGGQWSGWRNSAVSHPPAPAGPASVTLTHDGANLTIDWAEVAAASGYHLDLREAAASRWTRQSTGLTATTATVAAPNPNAGYQARVQAVNSGGASAWTESAEVFPSNLPPATPYWVKLRRTSYDHVTATWHAIPNAAGYEVQYMERRGDWQLWAENLTDATDELLDAGKSYMVRVRAKNANGSSPWQTSDALNSPTLATGGIYVNVVDLNIFNYYGSWYYKADVGPHSTCTGPAPNIHPTISGLAAGTTYTYTAYDHATCDGDPLTPPVTFTTLSPQWLSFSNVARHAEHPRQISYDKWWYARLGVPNSFNCVEVSGSSANLTGLTAKTLYDYAPTPLPATKRIYWTGRASPPRTPAWAT